MKERRYNFKRMLKMDNEGIISVLDSLFRRHDDTGFTRIWHAESAKFTKCVDGICIHWFDFEDVYDVVITENQITRIVDMYHSAGKKTDIIFVNPPKSEDVNHE